MNPEIMLGLYKEQRLVDVSPVRSLDEARAIMAALDRDMADTAYIDYPDATYTYKRKGALWAQTLVVIGPRR